jgi:hypothetical protein
VSPAASVTFSPPADELGGKLADGGGLAGAVDADHQNDMGLVAEVKFQRSCHWTKNPCDLVGHHLLHFGRRDVLAVAGRGQRVGDSHRGLDPEIGLQQDVFQFLEGLLVQLALGEDAGDLAGELARGARQALAQALPPVAAVLLLRFGGLFRLRLRNRVADHELSRLRAG